MKKITIFIVVLLALLYLPTCVWLVNLWLTDPYYTHGFLIVIISCVIAWLNIQRYNNECEIEQPGPFGIYIFAFGLFLFAIGIIKVFPFLTALSFLFTATGLLLYFYGKRMLRALLFPIAYLIFAIPLPVEWLSKVAYHLQSLSACYAASIIEMLGISIERTGAEIHLQNASFIVGAPCSGMNSLISLLALATIFIYILKCPLYKRAALLLVAVPIALFANILRIVSLLLIAETYGADTATGFFHTFFSPLLFFIAFICLILISIVIGCNVTARE